MIVKKLDRSDNSAKIIYKFIKDNEYLLPDPFSKHVDLILYSKKLNSLGETFIYMDKEKVRGLVSGYINQKEKKEAYLQIIIVSKIVQGNHVGSSLINAFVQYAREQFGNGTVFLTVDACNEKAYQVYKHLGFVDSSQKHIIPSKKNMVLFF